MSSLFTNTLFIFIFNIYACVCTYICMLLTRYFYIRLHQNTNAHTKARIPALILKYNAKKYTSFCVPLEKYSEK